MIDLIQQYWHWWLFYTLATWIAFVVGFYFKNKYGSKESSEVGRAFTFLFNYLLDVPCNLFMSLFPFFQLPAQWNELLTDRLIRNIKAIPNSFPVQPTDMMWYRWNLSLRICEWLSEIDKDHCYKEQL